MGFICKHIEQLDGYVPGEQPHFVGMVKLNTNENPYPPAPGVISAIREEAGERLRLYPDPEGSVLRHAIGRAYGMPEGRISHSKQGRAARRGVWWRRYSPCRRRAV